MVSNNDAADVWQQGTTMTTTNNNNNAATTTTDNNNNVATVCLVSYSLEMVASFACITSVKASIKSSAKDNKDEDNNGVAMLP